jgi:hypothetical protein
MMTVMAKPNFSVVGPHAIDDQPPRPLGEHGMRLWRSILAEYQIDDVAGRELLCLAAQGLDRAEALAAEVAADGMTVRGRTGVRAHPAIKEELAARAFVVRTLGRLGLNFEPLRAAPGHPPNLRGA